MTSWFDWKRPNTQNNVFPPPPTSEGAADAASCCLYGPLMPRPVFAGLIPQHIFLVLKSVPHVTVRAGVLDSVTSSDYESQDVIKNNK